MVVQKCGGITNSEDIEMENYRMITVTDQIMRVSDSRLTSSSNSSCQCTLLKQKSPVLNSNHVIESTASCLKSRHVQRLCVQNSTEIRHRKRPMNLSYLFQAALLAVLSVSSTMSAPIHHRDASVAGGSGSASTSGIAAPIGHKLTANRAKWISPCGPSSFVFNDKDTIPDMVELYNNIIAAIADAKRDAIRVKDEFLNGTFSDPSFEEGVKDIKTQAWLPEIPRATEGHLRAMDQEKAFVSSFELLQYFAVGIQQILLDETLHDGTYVQIFKHVEYQLTLVLCELQEGMYKLRIEPNEDVLRDVMDHQYRDISKLKTRYMRDYEILREYIKAVEYIGEIFAYLQTKVN